MGQSSPYFRLLRVFRVHQSCGKSPKDNLQVNENKIFIK
jgi:hypothetical protein